MPHWAFNVNIQKRYDSNKFSNAIFAEAQKQKLSRWFVHFFQIWFLMNLTFVFCTVVISFCVLLSYCTTNFQFLERYIVRWEIRIRDSETLGWCEQSNTTLSIVSVVLQCRFVMFGQVLRFRLNWKLSPG